MAEAVESATLEAIDKTLDVIEDQIVEIEEQVEKGAGLVVRFLKNENTIRTGLFLAGVGVGVGVYHLAFRAKMETKYEQIVAEEVAEAKVYYAKLNRAGEYSDPVKMLEAAQAAGEIADDNEYASGILPPHEHPVKAPSDERANRLGEHQKLKEKPPVVAEKKNVFEDAKSAHSVFDYDEEMKQRTELAPYIISFDEYTIGEEGFEQTRLTWFDGDDTLLDDQDGIIQDVEGVVGQQNLRFGHGSKDNKIVYVRNPVTEADYEVIKSEGTYVKEVLGFDDESSIQHSDNSGKRRRFSHDDE